MIVTVDLETYYSSEYSLSRMTEIDYILDPRFEFICCSVKVDNQPVQRAWGQAAIEALLRPLPWDRVALLAHNNRFDGAILAWRLGLVPALYLDTLSMARALTHAKIGRSSLAAVSDYLGLPPKGDEVVHARDKRLADFAPHEADRYMDYCDRDTDNCKAIFDAMRRSMPTTELAVIDWNLRMFIHPQVRLNSKMLAEHLHQVRADKEAAFGRLAHIDRAVFSSNQKFAALLESLGVEVPTKISPTTGKEMPALAKNDVAFKELAADESIPTDAQAAIAIRLSAKSTIEETRTEKMLNLSLREWGGGQRGVAPVPLKYYAAHTGRFGGDGGFNWQNFQRGSRVRQAVEAPPGYVIIHRDASQIEARMNAFLAGCERLLRAFERGEDIYSQFASIVYGRQVTRDDKIERFIGKTCLAENTIVVTDRGLVHIQDVTRDHRVWDGQEWVSHDGLLAQGLRETTTLCGVSLTPDHRVWCGTQWREAQYLAAEPGGRSLRSALAAANSPSPGTCLACGAAFNPLSCDAIAADQSMSSIAATFESSAALDATHARKSPPQGNAGGSMPLLCRTTRTAHGSSTGSPPPSPAATTQIAGYINTTVVAASSSTRNGATTAAASSVMCRHCQDGMIRRGIWTASTTTAGMNQEIFGSLPAAKTPETSALSLPSSSESQNLKPVYDLANAGPRHRFTILTERGLVVVSNCILGLGYGMGPPRFKVTLFLGQGGVSVRVTDDEARSIVQTYRKTYQEIPFLWERAEGMLFRMVGKSIAYDGSETSQRLLRRMTLPGVQAIPAIEFTANEIWLPNGLFIPYPNLRIEPADPTTGVGGGFVYDGPRGENDTRHLFGGKVVENLCQALSRIVITDIARRVRSEAGIWPWLTTHDSLDYCVPHQNAAEFDAYLDRQFAMRPEWAPTLPLASEGGWGFTLADAEKARNPTWTHSMISAA